MEHLKSTLATTACAVFGLVAAAHLLHPGNYEMPARAARTVAVAPVSAVPAAWTDPPARVVAAVAPAAPEPAARVAAASLPVAVETAQAEAQSERASKVAAAQRTKASRRAARTRRVAVARTAQADRPAVPDAPAPRKADRIDPIGDLIRGLGLGGAG